MNAVAEIPAAQTTDTGSTSLSWMTILYNCDCHSFFEVVLALVMALRCSPEIAFRYAMVAHTTGSAVVLLGTRGQCEAAARVLERMGLRVKVTK